MQIASGHTMNSPGLAQLAFTAVICATLLGARNADAQTTAASSLAFEVASVKPHVFARNQFAFGTASRESPIRISGNRVTTQGLLAGPVLTAYKLRTFPVSSAPEWRDETGRNQPYDIEAKAQGDGAPTMDEARQMLQTLLAERFQLKFHRETKELPAYDLVVGNNPAKLKPSAPDVESKTASTSRFRMDFTNGQPTTGRGGRSCQTLSRRRSATAPCSTATAAWIEGGAGEGAGGDPGDRPRAEAFGELESASFGVSFWSGLRRCSSTFPIQPTYHSLSVRGNGPTGSAFTCANWFLACPEVSRRPS
jgi:uncharacterized protein (TIGR03435 family)